MFGRTFTRIILTGYSALALGTGCLSLKGLSGYEEFNHDGRIYVLSRSETITGFKASHEVQYGVTKIGKGPKGETVVVEADVKDPWLEKTLWSMFCKAHGMQP